MAIEVTEQDHEVVEQRVRDSYGRRDYLTPTTAPRSGRVVTTPDDRNLTGIIMNRIRSGQVPPPQQRR